MNLKHLASSSADAGPLLLFLAFGMVNILGVKPFQALDEPRHAAYAVVLATGRIPNIREPIPYEVLHTGRIRGTNAMVAAVHPPLYYSVVALPVPPQNLVERTIVDVSALRAKLAYPDD